eukprot:gene9008-2961_t
MCRIVQSFWQARESLKREERTGKFYLSWDILHNFYLQRNMKDVTEQLARQECEKWRQWELGKKWMSSELQLGAYRGRDNLIEGELKWRREDLWNGRLYLETEFECDRREWLMTGEVIARKHITQQDTLLKDENKEREILATKALSKFSRNVTS